MAHCCVDAVWHYGVGPSRDKPLGEPDLTCQLRKGFFDFLFVSVGHPRTEVELGYTFGVPVINLALADLIPGT